MSAEVARPDETIDGSQVDAVERVMELTGGRGADVIITATAAKIPQEQAVAMAARNGRISFFGGRAKVQYPQASRHRWVRGTNTLRE